MNIFSKYGGIVVHLSCRDATVFLGEHFISASALIKEFMFFGNGSKILVFQIALCVTSLKKCDSSLIVGVSISYSTKCV